MSTITATPAPSLNRTPLLVGLAAVGVVAAAAVVIPHLPSSTSTTGSVPAVHAVPQAGGLDVVERQGIAERMRAEARLDHAAKTQGNYAGVRSGAASVPASVYESQVGGLHQTYVFPGSGSGSSAQHTVWNDTFVPPFGNPTWAQAIQAHYFGSAGDR